VACKRDAAGFVAKGADPKVRIPDLVLATVTGVCPLLDWHGLDPKLARNDESNSLGQSCLIKRYSADISMAEDATEWRKCNFSRI
jgi:hypothetical protein